MDTIRTLATERHFWTAQLDLTDYGQVLLIGDRAAVERLLEIVAQRGGHELVRLPDPLPLARPDR
jgi:hypothetical protein